MQTYANALLVAIPLFTVLVLAEALYGVYRGKQTLRHMDTISSLSSGITNVIKDSLGLVLIIVSYPFLVRHLALFSIENHWLLYGLAFLAVDFAGYWSHRLNHSVNYFWNHHVIHHSSEEFNLACALRQTISNVIGVYAIFLVPAAILGVPKEVINVIAPIHLFLQFWYHTRHLPKLGFLEYIIITPSQHRVHHAINPEYLDKNLGQIFTWWDRMFGTFQEELDDVPPVYGVTRPARTWNPIKINFQHLGLLMKDAWRTEKWWDKLRLWFMPTGWRPADVEARYPVFKIEDPYHFEKYDSESFPSLVAWSWFQLLSLIGLLLFMLSQFTDLGPQGLLVHSLVLMVGTYGFTSLMDRERIAVWIEVLRGTGGLVYMVWAGGWFTAAELLPSADLWVGLYFVATAVGGIYFGWFRMPRTLTGDLATS